MTLLTIKNLCAQVEGKAILRDFSLEVKAGEIHAIMGPNGAGKSTLAKVLGGHPEYEVTSGQILLDGEDILEMEPEERAAAGLFMGFQYPVEIPGITNKQFLHSALKARTDISEQDFEKRLAEKMEQIQVREEFAERNVNEGFSGGEKKRNEVLQMAMLDPKLAILDETDSGLDIDALRIVADGIQQLMTADRGLILITHYQRLLNYVKPDHVHVMVDGQIIESGGPELAERLEAEGYKNADT